MVEIGFLRLAEKMFGYSYFNFMSFNIYHHKCSFIWFQKHFDVPKNIKVLNSIFPLETLLQI